MEVKAPIDNDIEYDGVHYKNAIKITGDIPLGQRYFQIRAYDEKKDSHLPVGRVCLAVLNPPMNVPAFVSLGESKTNCH